MEQARAILLSGDLQHACDTAAEVLGTKASQEVHFAAHALCGLLLHTLWAASLQSGAAGVLRQSCPPLFRLRSIAWMTVLLTLEIQSGQEAHPLRGLQPSHLAPMLRQLLMCLRRAEQWSQVPMQSEA